MPNNWKQYTPITSERDSDLDGGRVGIIAVNLTSRDLGYRRACGRRKEGGTNHEERYEGDNEGFEAAFLARRSH